MNPFNDYRAWSFYNYNNTTRTSVHFYTYVCMYVCTILSLSLSFSAYKLVQSRSLVFFSSLLHCIVCMSLPVFLG